jgi:hypothetical protein
MTKRLRRLFVAFLGVGAFFAIVFGLSLVWSWREVRQLHAYCAAAVPGTPLSALPELTEKHGFTSAAERAARGKPDDFQVFLVPSYTVSGFFTCVIRHDGAVVISASIDES